jgi:hypothetical protein
MPTPAVVLAAALRSDPDRRTTAAHKLASGEPGSGGVGLLGAYRARIPTMAVSISLG